MSPPLIELPPDLAAELRRLPSPDGSRLRAAARRLSDAYRSGGATAVSDEHDAIAYAIYRMPATYAAATAALKKTALALPDWAPRSLLDVGAGPGTAAWAATRVFPSLREISLLEPNEHMRQIGERLAQSDCLLRDATWTGDVGSQADLVVASYSLGEMPIAAKKLWTAARHVLVIVEPGTPAGCRTVLNARRIAVEHGGVVAAPCPHSDPCPLQPPAWCHFSQRLPRSGVHRSLKEASLSWEDETFSYVAVSRMSPFPARARVIGWPRYGRHLVTLSVCARDGIERRLVPKSDPSYRAARNAHWGDSFDS